MLCEYDALPEIGHACGHNIIGTAGLGAGLAAAALADELGGRVVILGTPAEEGGGGKVFVAERGGLDGVDAAMMVHPAGLDLVRMDVIAIHQLFIEYHGEAAHAAAFPFKGRNALDAAVLGYNAVAALRQHIRPDERIHGIFTHAGDKPNIVPKYARANWYVRSPTLKSLEKLKPRGPRLPRGRCRRRRVRVQHRVGRPRLRRHARQRPDGHRLRRQRRRLHRPAAGRPVGRSASRWSAPPTWATSATRCRRSTR